jgi:AraC-like DNA-binding protein
MLVERRAEEDIMAKREQLLSFEPERRAAARFPVTTPARVTFPRRGQSGCATARLADLSVSGCNLIFDDTVPSLGDEVLIRLGSSLYGAGQVVRVAELSGKAGVAVKLSIPDPSQTAAEGAGHATAGSPWCLRLDGIKQDVFNKDVRLRKLRVLTYRYYRNSLKAGMAACATGLDPVYFSSFFSRTTGVPFSSWVQWVRLTKAMNLLATSDYSISEVAHLVGFHTLRSFERVFLQHSGITARQFKKLQVPASNGVGKRGT